MNFRPATVEDAPSLAKVHVDAWHTVYRGIVSDVFLAGFTYQRREAGFRKALAAGLEETYVAEEGDGPVGFLTVGPCRDADVDVKLVGEIWGIYISPACWGKGIGRYLCRQGETLLRSRGCREAMLWVLEGNRQARGFYEAMGFALDGASKDVKLGEAMRAVRYRKALGQAAS